MNKWLMSVCAVGALLNANSNASDLERYVISDSSAPIAAMSTAKQAEHSYMARLQAIENTNLRFKSDASIAGVYVHRQLQTLGAISFAEMTVEQVEEMRALGYTVEKQHSAYLVGLEQPFPGIVSDNNWQVQADTVPWGVAKVEADQVWSQATGAGVRTCVIDTGIDVDHSDLSSNFVTGTRTNEPGNTDPQDLNGHGTHVAGSLAANLNGSGVVGVAPEAELYVAAVFGASGTTTEEAILAGLDWCVGQNVRVANMSYGATGASSASDAAYQAAYDAGLVMVAATGNKGANTTIGFPANYDTTIAVGATDSSDVIVRSSQRGEEIDLVAPGFLIVSTANGGGTATLTGTSMATPHVAGAAAVLLSIDPSLSQEAVRNILRETADDLGVAGWDSTFGAGRLNVKNAVDSLGSDLPFAPDAEFSFTTDQLNVAFSDASSDTDGTILSWSWDFGDDTTSSDRNPVHRYAVNGDYTVTLTVTDDSGLSDSSSQTVSVNDGTSPVIEASIEKSGFWFWTWDIITWQGATTESVDIYRNGALLVTTPNDGSYSTALTSGTSYAYQVCESGSSVNCSEVIE